jgi:cardiolipin synthase
VAEPDVGPDGPEDKAPEREPSEGRQRIERARERTAERMELAREATAERMEQAREQVERARLTTRRLLGLDRSGPPPPETLSGHPLNPWTIPNAIGFVRLALIPVFLYLAFESDGTGTAAVIVFAVIAFSDYLDGMSARITGQYSRLGALLDPITDRLLVVSGVFVCFWFELLPRWALIVLVVRELLMLVGGRVALTHGIELSINWPGRIGVWPVMAALGAALLGWKLAAEILLYIGLFFTVWSTALYARTLISGLRESRP